MWPPCFEDAPALSHVGRAGAVRRRGTGWSSNLDRLAKQNEWSTCLELQPSACVMPDVLPTREGVSVLRGLVGMVTNTGCGWMMWRGRVYVVRGLTDGLFRDL